MTIETETHKKLYQTNDASQSESIVPAYVPVHALKKHNSRIASIVCVTAMIFFSIILLVLSIISIRCVRETTECNACAGLLTNIVCTNIDCKLFFDVYCESGSISGGQTMITIDLSSANNYTLNNTYDIYPDCSNTSDDNFSLDPTYYSYCAQKSFILMVLPFLILFVLIVFIFICIFLCLNHCDSHR
jgi:hypothetical protein